METNHTQGKWEYLDTQQHPNDEAETVQTPKFAFDICHMTCISKEEAVANARLISAAPDLLSALEMLTSAYMETVQLDTGKDCSLSSHILICKAAIAKAKGEGVAQNPFLKTWESSSTVAKTTYNNHEKKLVVEFKNGQQYEYSDFPETAWNEMIAVESIGSYVQKKLKGNYPVTQLKSL